MDQKFKSKWECSNQLMFHQKDFGYYQGFSWPRRSFICNFCNKEYKSAQALGGHMNVHRRDKARLGLSSLPSLDHHTRHPNPNLNPNYISSSSPVRFLPYNTSHSSLFSMVSTTNTRKDDQRKFPLFACSQQVMEEEAEQEEERGNGGRVWKKYEILNMEMEMGFLKDGNIELDLELRLGRS